MEVAHARLFKMAHLLWRMLLVAFHKNRAKRANHTDHIGLDVFWSTQRLQGAYQMACHFVNSSPPNTRRSPIKYVIHACVTASESVQWTLLRNIGRCEKLLLFALKQYKVKNTLVDNIITFCAAEIWKWLMNSMPSFLCLAHVRGDFYVVYFKFYTVRYGW